jgi:hypothetical protein
MGKLRNVSPQDAARLAYLLQASVETDDKRVKG